MPNHNRHIIVIASVVAALVAAVVGVGATAWANHQFPDVPTSSPFHDDIEDFVNAGCATGFPDDTFRPQDNVKRQQMARFFAACGGQVDYDDVETPIALSNVLAGTNLETVEIDAGALGGTGGFVLAIASVEARSTNLADEVDCPVEFTLFDPDEVNTTVDEKAHVNIVGTPLSTDTAYGSLIDILPASPGETQRWTVKARTTIDCSPSTITGDVALTAIYVPFAPTL